MGLLARIVATSIVVLAAILLQRYWQFTRNGQLPNLNVTEYWGPGDPPKKSPITVIKPLKIQIEPAVIEDLKQQLQRPVRSNEPLEGIAFENGFNPNELEKVITYWRDTYLPKWPEREKYLKKFKHYSTVVQGLRLHFIHSKAADTGNKKVIPLLLLHGWPGSILEFYDIIPLLTTPNEKTDYVFEVVAPSLPGYGWSHAAAKQNFGPAQMAVVLRNLMVQLDYERFLVQGGDWGAMIGSHMATLFPENVIGYHSNWCFSTHPFSMLAAIVTRLFPSCFISKEHVDFYRPLGDFIGNVLTESGYFHIQATKPETIGLALANSPVGLATYILEKFSTWTNLEHRSLPDGGLTKKFDLDRLLDNVMIYYVTNTITTSMRIYLEESTMAQCDLGLDRVPVRVPTGCARFKNDLMQHTDYELRFKFKNIIHSTHHMDGGHFAAMEVPQILYDDFIEFVEKIGDL